MAFSDCHPAVSGAFFVLVLLFTLGLPHPACLGISLCCAVALHARLGGRRALRESLWAGLPLMLLAAALNPAFSHAGGTILAYLPAGNPLTLESILYGLWAAGLLGAALSWFACVTKIMTADKLVYLFGRAMPALGLVLSMTLRFVPAFRARLTRVREARRGVTGEETGRLRRLRAAVGAVSILVTWALEHGVETADSMRGRGYGLPGRTAFSLYRLGRRDRLLLGWLGFCGFYLLCGWAAGGMDWRWYPTVRGAAATPFGWSFFMVYLLLCLTPLLLEWKEDRQWKRLRSGT